MELQSLRTSGSTLEACLDDLGDLVALLDRYPPTLLAVALRLHLEALLQALLYARVISRFASQNLHDVLH